MGRTKTNTRRHRYARRTPAAQLRREEREHARIMSSLKGALQDTERWTSEEMTLLTTAMAEHTHWHATYVAWNAEG